MGAFPWFSTWNLWSAWSHVYAYVYIYIYICMRTRSYKYMWVWHFRKVNPIYGETWPEIITYLGTHTHTPAWNCIILYLYISRHIAKHPEKRMHTDEQIANDEKYWQTSKSCFLVFCQSHTVCSELHGCQQSPQVIRLLKYHVASWYYQLQSQGTAL